MATYERKRLIRQTLMELGVLDGNESIEARQYEDADDIVQQKLEELYDDSLIHFDLDGDIPARYMIPLSLVIAAELAGKYGVDQQTASAKAQEGMKRLWKLAEKPDTGMTVRADYY